MHRCRPMSHPGLRKCSKDHCQCKYLPLICTFIPRLSTADSSRFLATIRMNSSSLLGTNNEESLESVTLSTCQVMYFRFGKKLENFIQLKAFIRYKECCDGVRKASEQTAVWWRLRILCLPQCDKVQESHHQILRIFGQREAPDHHTQAGSALTSKREPEFL